MNAILATEHLGDLRNSGISDEVIKAVGYCSVENYRQACAVVAPRTLIPFTGGALMIPQWNADGEPNGNFQVRPDNPPVKVENGKEKRLKYLTPGGQVTQLDFPPTLLTAILDVTQPLIITEGRKKGDAATTAGYACLILSGVTMWQRNGVMYPEWDRIPLDGRSVYIGFDHDVMAKKEVRTQANKLAAALRERGATVRFILLPALNGDTGTGIDDWLVANPGGDLYALAVDELPGDEDADPVYPRTQQGCAERLADKYGDVIGYCATTGWFVWNGKLWINDVDSKDKVRKLVMGLRADIYREVGEMQRAGIGEEELGKHKKLAFDVQGSHYQRSIMEQLQTLVYKRSDSFDTHPDLFTVGNGTLVFGDDGTVTLRNHDSRDRITLGTDTDYDPDAECPFFMDTMTKALPEDVRAFVQRATGYSMIGGNGEQIIVINHGTGGNLKSTYMEAVKCALGTQCIDVDPSTLRKSVREGSAPSPDKMRLRGPRFVSSVETSQTGGAQTDTEFLKRISGGEPIVARQLHGQTVSFEPQFVLWLSTNHIPELNDDSHGMWRRVRLVPWRYRMTDADRIDMDTVRRTLVSEAKGILAWMVRGAAEYRRKGLAAPQEVTDYTNQARADLDWFTGFVEECVTEALEGSVLRSEVWQAFASWRGSSPELRSLRKSDVNRRCEEAWGVPVWVNNGNGGRGHGWQGKKMLDRWSI